MKTTAKVISVLLVLACLCGCLFTITASATPTTASVSTDKTDYAVNETVTFTISSNGTSNTLWIYRVDGEWQNYYQGVSTGFTLAFGWEGTYEALVEAWDNTGSCQSSRITFNVGAPTVIESGPPTTATISVSKLVYNIGETVTFTISSDGKKNNLWIYAPNPNTGRPGTSGQVYEDAGTSYSLTFTQVGQYSALVEAWNGIGSKQSQKIGFTIVDPATAKPTTAKPTTAAPTTAKPTTAAPTTAKPTTAAPTTAKPTTAKPTTAAPTTAKPTTAKPTTAAPTTAKPTTAKPTTAAPTTAKPTTAAPTTAKPTTAKPVTVKPTNKVVKPNSAAVITNKQVYTVGESVSFVCSGNGTSHTLWIYYPNGTQKSYANVGATYSLTFNVPGLYGALLQTKNSAGTFESQAITFNVKLAEATQPTTPADPQPTTPPETQPTTPPETEPEVIPSWLTRPSTTPQGTQPSGGSSSNNGSFWLWLWLAVALLVVFVVILIVLMAKKKKKEN